MVTVPPVTEMSPESERALLAAAWGSGLGRVVEGGEQLGANWPLEPGTWGQPRPFSTWRRTQGFHFTRGL